MIRRFLPLAILALGGCTIVPLPVRNPQREMESMQQAERELAEALVAEAFAYGRVMGIWCMEDLRTMSHADSAVCRVTDGLTREKALIAIKWYRENGSDEAARRRHKR